MLARACVSTQFVRVDARVARARTALPCYATCATRLLMAPVHLAFAGYGMHAGSPHAHASAMSHMDGILICRAWRVCTVPPRVSAARKYASMLLANRCMPRPCVHSSTWLRVQMLSMRMLCVHKPRMLTPCACGPLACMHLLRIRRPGACEHIACAYPCAPAGLGYADALQCVCVCGLRAVRVCVPCAFACRARARLRARLRAHLRSVCTSPMYGLSTSRAHAACAC